jgi:hypothetical protein
MKEVEKVDVFIALAISQSSSSCRFFSLVVNAIMHENNGNKNHKTMLRLR